MQRFLGPPISNVFGGWFEPFRVRKKASSAAAMRREDPAISVLFLITVPSMLSVLGLG